VSCKVIVTGGEGNEHNTPIIVTAEAYRPTQIKAEVLYYFNKKAQLLNSFLSVCPSVSEQLSIRHTWPSIGEVQLKYMYNASCNL